MVADDDGWLICCVSLLAMWCLGFPWLVAMWWLLSGFADDGVGFLAM